MRVVVDTNIIVSAYLGGALEGIIVAWKSDFVIPLESLNVVQDDPTDNKFLEAAVAGNANLIVSGDEHLLEIKSFRNISIIKPRRFVDMLQSED